MLRCSAEIDSKTKCTTKVNLHYLIVWPDRKIGFQWGRVDLVGQCEKMGLADFTGNILNPLSFIYAVYLMGQGGLGRAM